MLLDDQALTQIQITDEPKPRVATITHYSNGKLNVKYDCDPLAGMTMMAGAAYAILVEEIKPIDKPVLPGVNSKVCIQLEDGKVTMAFGTEADGQTTADPNVAKALMLTALMGLCEKTATGKFNPIEAFSGMLTV
jgi:hypothetical protein